MVNQLISNAEALRLFFTDDVYLVENETKNAEAKPVTPVFYTPPVATPSVVEEPIVATAVADASVVAEPRKFTYIGKYLKGVLILVNDKANKVSTAEGNLLLRNLVDAIQFKNDDFAVLNYASYNDANLTELIAFFKFDILLSFGVTPAELGVNHPVNQLCFADEAKMVFTSNLHELSSDKETKKILWTSLQKLK